MARRGQPLTMKRDDDTREEVAAHQSTCRCHRVKFKSGVLGAFSCCDADMFVVRSAKDVRGNLWHLDPLCKRRPEAEP